MSVLRLAHYEKIEAIQPDEVPVQPGEVPIQSDEMPVQPDEVPVQQETAERGIDDTISIRLRNQMLEKTEK